MALVTKTFSDIITFTRTGTSATYFNSAGVLTTAGANVPRFDYNPSTLAAQGLLIEEARTNSIRNNTMQGAAAGTPGTAPTNWAVTGAGGNIASREIVGVGTENGIEYIDIKFVFSGAATANIRHEQAGISAATNTQTWTASSFVKLVGGTLSNITTNIAINQYNAGTANLETSTTAFTAQTSALGTSRPTHTKATNQATVASVASLVQIVASGAADITLRIGLPQLEQGAFATSVIPTTTTALTRSADVGNVNTLAPWYNATEGSLYVEWVTAANDPTNNRGIAALDDGSNNNRVALFIPNSFTPLAVAARVVSGGTATNPANAGSIALSSTAKTALAYGVGTNQAALCVNGATPTTASPAAAPIGVNALRIGAIFGVTQLGGWIRRITYYPRRLSNAELQAITA